MNASYYRKIDSLRNKFEKNKPLTIKEFCWIQWAEYYVLSAQYLQFEPWLKRNGVRDLVQRKFKFPIWQGLWTSFSTEYAKQELRI